MPDESSAPAPPAPAELIVPAAPVPPTILEQWKQVVAVQMHFNDILMRTRTLAITVVLGAYGAAAVAVAQYPNHNLFFWNSYVHISTFVVLFALVLLTGVAVLDVGYYLRLLLAAVEKGEQLEKENPGLAGITVNASKSVRRWLAWTVITVFYALPTFTGLAFLYFLVFRYPPLIGV